ncbi:hypothetical protein ABIE33_006070 [Ensifer sp. 4252]
MVKFTPRPLRTRRLAKTRARSPADPQVLPVAGNATRQALDLVDRPLHSSLSDARRRLKRQGENEYASMRVVLSGEKMSPVSLHDRAADDQSHPHALTSSCISGSSGLIWTPSWREISTMVTSSMSELASCHGRVATGTSRCVRHLRATPSRTPLRQSCIRVLRLLQPRHTAVSIHPRARYL